jgi:pyruvate dehydrogenase (quinone)
VLNNHDLNLVTWEQRVLVGDPKFTASQYVPDFQYAQYAESLGLKGIRVDSPEGVGPAWEQAARSDRPVVVEAITDPNVPPLPPHITFEQAKAFAMSILKGDPDAVGVVRQSFKDLVEQYLPHKGKG